jgi:hypothetical protein
MKKRCRSCLIAADVNFNNRPMGRPLTGAEGTTLEAIDPVFWNRELTFEGETHKRPELALVYDPAPKWNFFDLVQAVIVPERAVGRVQSIVPDKPVQHFAACGMGEM